MKRIALITALISTLFPACANAQSFNLVANYQRIGAGESLTAPFVNSAGTPTIGTYSGLTEVVVSGTGFALGPSVSDAFYFLDGSPVGVYYGLNIGYTGLPFAGGPANNIQATMEFIDTVGMVAPGTIPPFRSGNDYRFIINLPETAGVLQFGVSDGAYIDNGGAYNISVYPVVRSTVAVPEPSALLLFALPLAGTVVRRRFSAKRN